MMIFGRGGGKYSYRRNVHLPRRPVVLFRLWIFLVVSITSVTISWRLSNRIGIPSDEELAINPLPDKMTASKNNETIHIESFRASAGKMESTIQIMSQQRRSFRSNAIVILAQKKHSTYQRDSYGYLIKSLDLIYKNYLSLNDHFNNVDVFIFHTGDFDETDLTILNPHLGGISGLIKLINLNESPYWYLPPWHQKDNQTNWQQADVYPVGYRHMCRWFGIRIWQFFQDLNTALGSQYRYILRIDEDSFILSPINYDIFDYMKSNGFVYGFRLCAYELGYNRFIRPWFRQWHAKTNPKREITDDLCGLYNNFFVADIEFFQSPPVKKYLNSLDRQGFVYRKRYGDLMIHTSAVYAYADSTQIHRFLDFTYQHLSTEHVIDSQIGCVTWGGIQAGYSDQRANDNLAEFTREWMPTDGRNCTSPRIDLIPAADLSPSYQHLPPSFQDDLVLQTIMVGNVELPNMGKLSG